MPQHDNGLPPPTRGIRRCPRLRIPQGRSTPAHAGNTCLSAPTRRLCLVYPRPRGEYVVRRAIVARCLGLPPPTRGIPSNLAIYHDSLGSTPAHAGNTGYKDELSRLVRVYPRPRGEYLIANPILLGIAGLPPPTRGIRDKACFNPEHQGSTPAHAGNTPSSSRQPRPTAVYPRPRGEYALWFMDEAGLRGLPPPTRGIR